MNPCSGYTNHLAAYQEPKYDRTQILGKANLKSKTLSDKTSSDYEWNQSLKQHERFVGCGEINTSLTCQCSECGWPADGPDQAACPRCGTTNEPRCN